MINKMSDFKIKTGSVLLILPITSDFNMDWNGI